MIRFNIKSTEASYEEITSWFVSRNAEFNIVGITDVKDWWHGSPTYQVYDIDIADEHVAIEFRLTFDSQKGESFEHARKSVEDELLNAIQENMTKLIDEQVTQELIALANNELKVTELMKVYDISDMYPTTIPKATK
jgi:hypothetical protein